MTYMKLKQIDEYGEYGEHSENSGRLFNPDAKTHQCWEEDTRWDGRNRISCATGSPWVHERLYRTKSGRWIIYSWSQWQGSLPYAYETGERDAAEWLLLNSEELPASLAHLEEELAV